MTVVLKNKAGVEAHIIPTGAVIQRLLVPDAQGRVADVVLGFDEVEPYGDGTSPYFGAVVGRVANRIAGATFELDGVRYKLAANNGPNCLHGGVLGFSRREWEVAAQGSDGGGSQWVQLTYRSADGEEVRGGASLPCLSQRCSFIRRSWLRAPRQVCTACRRFPAHTRSRRRLLQGFPGEVGAAVTYSLSPSSELRVEMRAESSAPTPLNLAQHSYFNLGGHAAGTILDHQLALPNA